MIVRHEDDDFLLVTQPEHAALSGRVMAAWCADGLPASPARKTVLLATREHDNGWIEVDDRPRLDAARGRPQDFMTAPDATKQGIWPRGVRRLERVDRAAAALVAQHALALGAAGVSQQRSFQRDRQVALQPLPGWERFLAEMTTERDRILGNGAYDNDPDALRADYRFVFLGDLISLVFCCEWSEEFRYDRYTIVRRGTAVHVAPDPFAGETVELTVPARRLPARRYASDGALRDAFDRAPAVSLRGTARGPLDVRGQEPAQTTRSRTLE